MHRLTAKRERFCLEMIKPQRNQSDAYRAAFKAKKMKPRTIHQEASRLMADPHITARIAELTRPAIEQIQTTRNDWLLELGKAMRADIRKMFDSFGNPINLPELEENEATIIEAVEVVEHYTKVKTVHGETEAVLTSRTARYKFTPRIKVLLEFGKAMGWYSEPKDVGLGTTLEELVLRSMERD